MSDSWQMGQLAAQNEYRPMPWGSDPWVNRLGPTPEMVEQRKADEASQRAAFNYEQQQRVNADETQAYRGTPRLDPGLRRAPGDLAATPTAQGIGELGGEILTDPLTYTPFGVASRLAKLGAAATTMGSVLQPEPAQAGVIGGIRRGARRMSGLADQSAYKAADQAPPGIGHNNPPIEHLPPTGSMNPLDNVDVTFRGKQPSEFSPEDLQAFGEHYGAKNIGPLSPPKVYTDMHGNQFSVPGGTEGTWTYADTLYMKANPINPSNVDRALHAEMQRKLGRTMTPENVDDAHVWNALVFGMTSPNNPLFPNQMAASRLRMRDPKMLDDLASMIPWELGKSVPKAQRKLVQDQIAARYGLNAAEEGGQGGLGVRGTADYSRIGELAKMFKQNPEFFRKRPDEEWGQFVERLSSQTPGLSMKTASFGGVWQDPAKAAISAIDRHMARELDKRGGGIFANEADRSAWQDRGVALWNKRELDRVAEQTEANAKAAKKGKAVRDVAPADLAKGFDDMVAKTGSDGHIGEMLLQHVGASSEPKFKLASGAINPNLPPHLRDANWIVEPDKVNIMGQTYKRALDVNQKIADENGLALFMSQWMEWDRIRNRFEPHENMFPGLSKLPAMSIDQLRKVDEAHKATGHKTYGKNDDGTLPPTRPFANPAGLGYFGIGGLAAGALDEHSRTIDQARR